MSGFHFGVMDLNLNVIVKGYQNMNKLYDNGLTPEQQKQVDKAYEELMQELKKVNRIKYDQMMKEVEAINSGKEVIKVKDDNQFDLFA
tara:strand:+ start:516 stop:779 length:264 start_codon:yes stop_codon:yes gene_type:complete